jgi:hypothetical protein
MGCRGEIGQSWRTGVFCADLGRDGLPPIHKSHQRVDSIHCNQSRSASSGYVKVEAGWFLQMADHIEEILSRRLVDRAQVTDNSDPAAAVFGRAGIRLRNLAKLNDQLVLSLPI